MKALARLIALFSLVSLAGAASAQPPAAAAPNWVEGKNYFLIAQPQPTNLPKGKVLVTEVFSYACPACNQFRPYMQKLSASAAAECRARLHSGLVQSGRGLADVSAAPT